MPITFDTLDELEAFYRTFKLEEGAAKSIRATTPASTHTADAPRRGRPAGIVRQTESDALEPRRRGRRPGSTVAPKAVKKATSLSLAPKRDKGNTLTARIQDAIRQFLAGKKEFTANHVYAVLAKSDDSINKQSVITSVLKQMNSTFKDVSVAERPGNGPRPVKMYNV